MPWMSIKLVDINWKSIDSIQCSVDGAKGKERERERREKRTHRQVLWLDELSNQNFSFSCWTQLTSDPNAIDRPTTPPPLAKEQTAKEVGGSKKKSRKMKAMPIKNNLCVRVWLCTRLCRVHSMSSFGGERVLGLAAKIDTSACVDR